MIYFATLVMFYVILLLSRSFFPAILARGLFPILLEKALAKKIAADNISDSVKIKKSHNFWCAAE